jgi:hypothetical protein
MEEKIAPAILRKEACISSAGEGKIISEFRRRGFPFGKEA